LAFAASVLADFKGGTVFADHTAGHGMLMIGANPEGAIAYNELDPARVERLKRFAKAFGRRVVVNNFDATSPEFFATAQRTKVDRLGLNPPFGTKLDEFGESSVKYPLHGALVSQKHTSMLDMAIALNSLEAMAPTGKAFVIIGAKTGTPWGGTFGSDESRMKGYERPAFIDLFARFNVVDWFTIGGDLYRKMGAAWPVDVIIVHGKGRTKPSKEGGLVRPWMKPPRGLSWPRLSLRHNMTASKHHNQSLAEQAQPKLGEALAALALAQEAENPRDPESRRYLLHDLNDLLVRAVGPGAEVFSNQLNDPDQLTRHLRASLEIPAMELARALPNRLTTWMREEPQANSPNRLEWAEKGRWLLEQVTKSSPE
jgi:hypothetical protein